MAGRPPLIGALLLLLSLGCERGTKEQPARSAPYADGRRLATATAGFGERWRKSPELPHCGKLLAGGDGAVCDTARAALVAMRRAHDDPKEAEIIGRAGALALASHRAAEQLRRASIEAMMQERSARPASSAPPTPSSRPSAEPVPRGASSLPLSAEDTPVRVHDNTHLAAVAAYARASALGLRQLAAYLENAPLSTRRRAFAELTRLAGEERRWSGLRGLVAEALLVEPNAELKRDLEKLRAELGKR